MPKLTKKAIRYGRTDPNYRKASLLKIVDGTCHCLADAGSKAGGCHRQLVDDRLQTNGGDIPQLFLLPHHVVA